MFSSPIPIEALKYVVTQSFHSSLSKNIRYLETNKEESEMFIRNSPKKTDKNLSDVFLFRVSEDFKDSITKLVYITLRILFK